MVTEIQRDELKQKLDHPRKSVLVEALPTKDFCNLHLPGAINIPADQVRTLAPELLPNKDHFEVIVYSAGPTCHSSESVARELVEIGYSKVRRYAGGKQDWIDAGLPVVTNGTQQAA